MPQGSLSALQGRILAALAGMEPPWTLTGGAALAGFYTKHRATRDLDLFWRGRSALEDLVDRVQEELVAHGLEVTSIQRAISFHRLSVRQGTDTCLVDLVAEAGSSLAPPERARIEGRDIAIDSRHEILVNKLCTLLGRSEIRDLVDLRALLETDGDLDRALRDAPAKDGGFSPLVLAWCLRGLRVADLARSYGQSPELASRLEAFRDDLVQRLTSGSKP